MTSAASLTADWHDVLSSTTLDIRRWRRTRPDLFGGCRSADDVLSAIRAAPDPILGFLIAEHLSEHPHAGRIVWHSMLPKMRAMTRRDPQASFEDYTGHLWLRLCTYPLAARPHRIAANLALDTLKAVKTEQVRGPGAFELRDTDQPVGDEVTARRILVTARELGLIDAATDQLLSTVYHHGIGGQDAADRLGISRALVRKRCSQAIRRLREHAPELLEA